MLPKRLLTVAALFAAALFILDVPAAMADTYRSAQSGDWDQLTTWEIFNDPNWATPTKDQGVPACGDNATIRNGHTVDVDTSESVDYVTVDSGGYIDIQASGTLTLCAASTSTISQDKGIYLSSSTSTLAVSANHTLSGSGSVEGRDNAAQIEISGNNTLTNTTTIEGALEIRAGSGTFVNGATGVVHANRITGDKILTLYSGTIDDVYSDPDRAEWKVSADTDAILRFSVAATGLEGDFIVHEGTLDVNANVWTTGDLDFDKASSTNPKIEIASGCSAKFNQ